MVNTDEVLVSKENVISFLLLRNRKLSRNKNKQENLTPMSLKTPVSVHLTEVLKLSFFLQ